MPGLLSRSALAVAPPRPAGLSGTGPTSLARALDTP